jgi:nucleotide-binding universal stress UspA family protein
MSGKIACLVRGGEAGRTVQEHTIAYAVEYDKTILFIHVVDSTIVENENERLKTAVHAELTWLGRVTVNIARRRAKQAGARSETVILYGTVQEASQDYLSSHLVERIFIGGPHPDTANFSLRLDRIQQFASQLGDATGVPVEIIPLLKDTVVTKD